MKAAVDQQRSLAEVVEIDAELARMAHRRAHLPEFQRYDEVQAQHRTANDRVATLQLALEDLQAQVTRFESEIDAVRKREDRDRSLLQSGTPDAKQLSDLQHELDTLQRRQSSLEDSLLEVMEQREELQINQTRELTSIDSLQAELASVQQARDEALAEIDTASEDRVERRTQLMAAAGFRARRALRTSAVVGRRRARDCCRGSVAGHAGSNSTGESWPVSPRPPTTTCCGARSAEQSC